MEREREREGEREGERGREREREGERGRERERVGERGREGERELYPISRLFGVSAESRTARSRAPFHQDRLPSNFILNGSSTGRRCAH